VLINRLACFIYFISLTAIGCSSTKGIHSRLNQEAIRATLIKIHEAQMTFRSKKENGKYGTLQELLTAGLIDSTIATGNYRGYFVKVRVTDNSFEAVAIPQIYGQTGSWSFFVNEEGVIRGEVKGGREATISDPPIQIE
jgi:hypothetical protein